MEDKEVTIMTTKTVEKKERKKPAQKVASPRKASPVNAGGVVSKLRKELNLSRREFSRLTGYSERAIVNWEMGRTPDEPALRRIKELDRLRARLAQVMKPEF